MSPGFLKALLAVMVAPALLVACATSDPVTCATGQQLAVQETLYFGTGRLGSGDVTPAEWQDFVAEVLTAAFPEGLTWWFAQGQWLAGGEVIREGAYILQLVLTPEEAASARFDAVIAAYKQGFDQSAVLQTSMPVCMSFNQ